MSIINYPDHLPSPSVQFSCRLESNLIETEFDSGYTRKRVKNTDTHEVYNATFIFKNEEKIFFENWLRLKCNQGASSFNINLSLGDNLQTYEVYIARGTYTSEKINNSAWSIQFELHTYNPNTLTEEQFDLLNDDLKGQESELNSILENARKAQESLENTLVGINI